MSSLNFAMLHLTSEEVMTISPKKSKNDFAKIMAAVRDDYIVSNDSNCLMQPQGSASREHLPVKTIHLAEILAGSNR
jgi:hypothetical protein